MERRDLDKDLFPYQLEDAKRILTSGRDTLENSEMGTGKTPKALYAIRELWDKGKILIVCPKTLQLEWYDLMVQWTGVKPSLARRSSYRKLETLFTGELNSEFDPAFITNYETFRVRRHLEVLFKYPFSVMVLDEGHVPRNPKTKLSKGLFAFLEAQRERKRPLLLPMTGSPIVNNPLDLHTLLCMVDPENFNLRTRSSFAHRYCIIASTWATSKYGRRRRINKVVGSRLMSELADRTKAYTIRRTKKEVLPFLPDKYYRKVILRMEPDQYKAYKSMEKDLFVMLEDGQKLSSPGVLSALTRLRQLNLEPSMLGVDAGSSKTEFLFELIDSMGINRPGADRKLVVFSTFRSYLKHLSIQLNLEGIKHVSIHGGVSQEERAIAVRRFQNDPEMPLILGTIKTMGVGITLTAASDVVMMDRWWNPTLNDQAVDRLHRITQKNAVQVIIPVNDESIDSSLDRILERKAKISSEYLGDTDIMKETVEDLRQTEGVWSE